MLIQHNWCWLRSAWITSLEPSDSINIAYHFIVAANQKVLLTLTLIFDVYERNCSHFSSFVVHSHFVHHSKPICFSFFCLYFPLVFHCIDFLIVGHRHRKKYPTNQLHNCHYNGVQRENSMKMYVEFVWWQQNQRNFTWPQFHREMFIHE